MLDYGLPLSILAPPSFLPKEVLSPFSFWLGYVSSISRRSEYGKKVKLFSGFLPNRSPSAGYIPLSDTVLSIGEDFRPTCDNGSLQPSSWYHSLVTSINPALTFKNSSLIKLFSNNPVWKYRVFSARALCDS